MNKVIGMSDVSSPDTGRGSVLKTGGRKKYNMKAMKCKVGQVYDMKLKKCVTKKADLNKDNRFNIKVLLKKLYKIGCRNLLIEGGNILTNSLSILICSS